jgi:hypothetical protein
LVGNKDSEDSDMLSDDNRYLAGEDNYNLAVYGNNPFELKYSQETIKKDILIEEKTF